VVLTLTVCFILGVANFCIHKAVAESGHPFVEETKLYFGRHLGPYGSYAIELALLIGAMWLANADSLAVSFLYAAYTSVNGVATWMLLSNKT
jgi:hypothetical protein